MNKAVITLGLILATISSGFAGVVSQQAAQTVAVNFFKSKTNATASATLKFAKTESNGTVDFYVFDITSGKGFVVVAADDNVTPVIAYSFESNFNTNVSATGVSDWMNNTAKHIQAAVTNHIQADEKIAGLWNNYKNGQVGHTKSVTRKPLLETTWGQEPYYNQYCPFNSVDQQRCLTGCAATAMAQIMKYWNYPAQGTGSYSYNNATPAFSHNYGVQSANFGATTYQWDSMPKEALTAPNSAVATLMYQCGVAASMDYGDDNQGGSGTYVLRSMVASWKHTAESAYVDYFNYDGNSIQGIYARDYNAAEWVRIIKHEITEGRPVQYVGEDLAMGGHTWVCDGFDDDNNLHMNWGWNGADNGYFNIGSLTANGFNFSNNQAALIGIRPIVDISVSATVATPTICHGGTTTLRALGSDLATYTWEPSTGLSCPTCAVTEASPNGPTEYTVTMDSAGFTAVATVTVDVRGGQFNPHLNDLQNVSCNGANNGSISVACNGGQSVSYVWNTGATTAAISGLSAGTYTLTVTDAYSCSATISQQISEPTVLNLSIITETPASVYVKGTATAVVNGGADNYTYLWNTGETTAAISGLSVGAYTITVVDGNNCTVTSAVKITKGADVAGVNHIEANSALYTGNTSADNSQDSSVIDNGAANNDSIGDNGGPLTVSVGNTTTQSNNVSTGVNSVEEGVVSLSVYPNPAQNVLNVVYGKNGADVTLNVKNILGQSIFSQNVSGVQNQIDLSTFANGVYVLEVMQGGHSSVQQFVVKH